jgi:hypothetical protein
MKQEKREEREARERKEEPCMCRFVCWLLLYVAMRKHIQIATSFFSRIQRPQRKEKGSKAKAQIYERSMHTATGTPLPAWQRQKEAVGKSNPMDGEVTCGWKLPAPAIHPDESVRAGAFSWGRTMPMPMPAGGRRRGTIHPCIAFSGHVRALSCVRSISRF